MSNKNEAKTPANTPTKKDLALEEFIRQTNPDEELLHEVPDSETIHEPAKRKPRKAKVEVQELPAKGTYAIEITPKSGKKIWTGNGKDWVVKSKDKAQVYKTRAGAERWIAKFAHAQGTCKIVTV